MGVLALSAACCAPARRGPVTVFAAASLQNALETAAQSYDREVRFSFAASSVLARQIEQGAPADIFISADEAWMDYLAERSRIAPESRVDLLSNRLVLIAPDDSTLRINLDRDMPIGAALGARGRLALAGEEVPAGRYARAALTALGVWPQVEKRLITGDSVRTALNFVARGEAPLGVVYETDARIEPRVRIVGRFPPSSHPPIVYPAALTRGAQREAERFLEWLQGPEAGAVFTAQGFARPAA